MVFFALTTTATSSGILQAQAAAPLRPALTAEVRARVIDSLTRTIEQLYPAADTGTAIARHVRARAAAGGGHAAAADLALDALPPCERSD